MRVNRVLLDMLEAWGDDYVMEPDGLSYPSETVEARMMEYGATPSGGHHDYSPDYSPSQESTRKAAQQVKDAISRVGPDGRPAIRLEFQNVLRCTYLYSKTEHPVTPQKTAKICGVDLWGLKKLHDDAIREIAKTLNVKPFE